MTLCQEALSILSDETATPLGSLTSLINKIHHTPTSPHLPTLYQPVTHYPSPKTASTIVDWISTLSTPFSYNPTSIPSTVISAPTRTSLLSLGGIGGLLVLFHNLSYTNLVLRVLDMMPDLTDGYREAVGTGKGKVGKGELRDMQSLHGSFIPRLLSPPSFPELLTTPGGDKHTGLRQAIKDSLRDSTGLPLVGYCGDVAMGEVGGKVAVYKACRDLGVKVQETWVECLASIGGAGEEEGREELWVRLGMEVDDMEHVGVLVDVAVGWGRRGWGRILRLRDPSGRSFNPVVWREYVMGVRGVWGEAEGWEGREGVCYEEGKRWGMKWEEEDRERIYDEIRGDLEGRGNGGGVAKGVRWLERVGDDGVMRAWVRIAKAVAEGGEGDGEDGDIVVKEMEGRRVEVGEGGMWAKGGEEVRVKEGILKGGKRGVVWLEGVLRRNKERKVNAE